MRERRSIRPSLLRKRRLNVSKSVALEFDPLRRFRRWRNIFNTVVNPCRRSADRRAAILRSGNGGRNGSVLYKIWKSVRCK